MTDKNKSIEIDGRELREFLENNIRETTLSQKIVAAAIVFLATVGGCTLMVTAYYVAKLANIF